MFNTTHHRTSAPDDYAFGEIDNRVGFYFLWFGLLFFFLLWIWGATRSCCWRLETARVGNTAEDANQELSRKNRKQRLVDHFESGKNKMVLTSENFEDVSNEENEEASCGEDMRDSTIDNDDYDVESNEPQMIRIKMVDNDAKEWVFSKQCAICLEAYKAGDSIVWSSSSHCSHVFHQDCLVDGLARVKNNETPCPCCRAPFCIFTTEEKETT